MKKKLFVAAAISLVLAVSSTISNVSLIAYEAIDSYSGHFEQESELAVVDYRWLHHRYTEDRIWEAISIWKSAQGLTVYNNRSMDTHNEADYMDFVNAMLSIDVNEILSIAFENGLSTNNPLSHDSFSDASAVKIFSDCGRYYSVLKGITSNFVSIHHEARVFIIDTSVGVITRPVDSPVDIFFADDLDEHPSAEFFSTSQTDSFWSETRWFHCPDTSVPLGSIYLPGGDFWSTPNCFSYWGTLPSYGLPTPVTRPIQAFPIRIVFSHPLTSRFFSPRNRAVVQTVHVVQVLRSDGSWYSLGQQLVATRQTNFFCLNRRCNQMIPECF
jgi:hypothetical protein